MAQEEGQEGKFLGREIQGMSATTGALRGEVDADIAVRQRQFGGALATAEEGADPGEQLVKGERLTEVVVSPGIETPDTLGDGVARRQEEDWNSAPGGSIAAQQVEPIFAGEPPVQEDQVPRPGLELFPRTGTVRRADGDEALLAQTANDEVGEFRLVFNHQDAETHGSVRGSVAILAARRPGGGGVTTPGHSTWQF